MASTMTEYRKRRAVMIEYLGGQCAVCGSVEHLHIDHVIASSKAFGISAHWSISWDRLRPELDKCQLLCAEHHRAKSIAAKDVPTPAQHGTRAMYRHHRCRCSMCKQAQTSYCRMYRMRRRGVVQLG